MISNIGVKMNLRIIMKNLEVHPEIGSLTKSISKPYDRATVIPPAWELKSKFLIKQFIIQFVLK